MKKKKNNKKIDLFKINIKLLKENFLDKKNYFIIIKNFEKNPKILKIKIKKIANLLGKTLPQNKAGTKIVEVKPNIELLNKFSSQKKLEKLRYHQTNVGGSIHSDGPQLNSPPKYILLACSKESNRGGHSIIAHSKRIYDFLKKEKPNYLKILMKKFLVERRGFNYPNGNIFEKPIFEKKKNFFRFRYLREYIESAYKIKRIKLTPKKIEALNFLDKLMQSNRFQKKLKLNQGDLIILNNNTLSHGRTKFNLNSGDDQRTLIRVWVK
jgi:alpha-ketoglutarate-dependent taurine dioxygenase|tara:strand:+ start:2304 stop:3104 length:801 start_codon:yes stop_codon:yes gene_type:complete